MLGSQKHQVERKKPDPKDYILFDSFSIKFPEQANLQRVDSWLPKTRMGVGTGYKQQKRPFQSDGNGLKLDYGNVTLLCKFIKNH